MAALLTGAWFFLPIQPEPWRTPPHGVGRKGGKLFVTSGSDEQLVAYQEAVRDLMRIHYEAPARESMQALAGGKPIKLTFYYFRQLGKGIQAADATNLNKALEDALQGVLYENDKAVNDVRGVIVEQSTEVLNPAAIVHLESGHIVPGIAADELPAHIWHKMACHQAAADTETDELVWPPRG